MNFDSVQYTFLSTAYISEFSVAQPRTLPLLGNKNMIFEHTLLNTGDFNPSSGTFVCNHTGYYQFTVSFSKNTTTVRVPYETAMDSGCSLYYNAQSLGRIAFPIFNQSNRNGEMRSTFDVKLNQGDIVYLNDCTYIGYMNSDSYFSGFLVRPQI